MKILVAEDNAISQELLRKILVNKGYEVVVAGDGKVAWDLMCQGLNPDLCILDIMMPVMSGLEVLQRIRRDVRFKKTKTILCSALRDRETIAQGATLGIEYYILKPFKPDLVIQQVQKALSNKGPEDSTLTATGSAGPELTPISSRTDDNFALMRAINTLADEAARGIEIARTALTASPLANGTATFHNEDHRRALSPHFENMRNLLAALDKENQQIRRKAPEASTTALAV
jgi:CheY-like chemotaxis protein